MKMLNSTHGMYKSKEYMAWLSMIKRCTNPKSQRYEDYGGRGIVVCDEWLNDFTAFYSHVGPAPFQNASLDRIDNDGNYKPYNVKWSTPKEQGRNRRTNKMITHDGRTQCLSAWADELEINRVVLDGRIRLGWPIDKVFTEPVKKR